MERKLWDLHIKDNDSNEQDLQFVCVYCCLHNIIRKHTSYVDIALGN